MRITRTRTATVVMAIAAVALRRVRQLVEDPGEQQHTTSPSSSTVSLTVASFTADFSAMAQLKDLAAKGKGLIGVLLPDTTTRRATSRTTART